MKNIQYRVCITSSIRIFVDYNTDKNNIKSKECHSDGWSSNTISEKLNYSSKLQKNDFNNDYSLSTKELIEKLNTISKDLEKKVSPENELEFGKLLTVLPVVIGEIGSDKSKSIQIERLNNLARVFNIDINFLDEMIDLPELNKLV